MDIKYDSGAFPIRAPSDLHGGIISAEQPQVNTYRTLFGIDYKYRGRTQASVSNSQVRSYHILGTSESTCQVYALDPITEFRFVSAYRPRFRFPGYLFEDRDSRDSNKQDLFEDRDSRDSNKQDGSTNFRRDV
jgi:hypothetical protein